MKMPYIPPQNIEAEEGILRVCLLHQKEIPCVLSTISSGDFYKNSNGFIFEAIENLFHNGSSVDLITVKDYLQNQDKLDQIGGSSYLLSLLKGIPLPSNVIDYCKIIKEKSIGRMMIDQGQCLITECYEESNIQKVIDSFGKRFFEIAAGKTKDIVPASELVDGYLDMVDQRCQRDDSLAGISTGFYDLDKMISGLVNTDLIIMAARPGMGKTALALNISQYVNSLDKRVLFFSLEMGKSQLLERLLSGMSGVNNKALRNGFLNNTTWPMIRSAAKELKKQKLLVDDTPALSLVQLKARAKMAHQRYGIDIIFIDYLQLMKADGENRVQEVSNISGGLKSLAKELNIPVVALAQLNRGLESRPDKRPLLSDLRESGSIEQDADTICFIYRDDYYNDSIDHPAKGLAELIIAKQRSGPTGTVKLLWDERTTKFKNLS
jgi:replicative DNA helicase